MISVGLLVDSMGRALRRTLFRLLCWEFFAKRDMIPVRVGLRFVVVAEVASLLENNTLLHVPLFGDVFPIRPGLDEGDFGGFRLMM